MSETKHNPSHLFREMAIIFEKVAWVLCSMLKRFVCACIQYANAGRVQGLFRFHTRAIAGADGMRAAVRLFLAPPRQRPTATRGRTCFAVQLVRSDRVRMSGALTRIRAPSKGLRCFWMNVRTRSNLDFACSQAVEKDIRGRSICGD